MRPTKRSPAWVFNLAFLSESTIQPNSRYLTMKADDNVSHRRTVVTIINSRLFGNLLYGTQTVQIVSIAFSWHRVQQIALEQCVWKCPEWRRP